MLFESDPLIHCPVCGKPTAGLDKYCSRKCRHAATHHTARTRSRQAHDVEFIGVDGEGVNIIHPDGRKEHRYVMLSVGDETLWQNGELLDHDDIFQFLYDHFLQHPEAVYIGFFLGYDFTMWLKSLSYEAGYLLFHKDGKALRKKTAWSKKGNPVPKPVIVAGWEIDIIGMRRFKIRPHIPRKAKGKAAPWLFVCDTGQFWQTSFLTVINPDKWTNGDLPCSPEEYEIIKEGKQDRGIWVKPGDISYFADMVRYNKLENEILARVMSILNRGFVQEGIYLKRDQYYGPGQAAQKWLDTLFDNDHWLRRKNLMAIVPEWVIDAFRASYYGGWFEAFFYGHVPGTTYEYDVRSAYPDAMRYLPCLCNSDGWTSGTMPFEPPIDADITLLFGMFSNTEPNPIGPLPYRIGPGNGQGRVIRPVATRGWYLLSEVRAAQRAGLISFVNVERWISYKAKCGHAPPLAILSDMYEKRKAVGKNTPHGKALKLILNSIYGKFAQSIGEPKYGNPIYASMITAHCRTKMLDAIATHPRGVDDVVMIATDGIYFRTPHPILDKYSVTDTLGEWEVASKHNLTVMKPGVYWDDKARTSTEDAISIKSRGISAKALWKNLASLDAAFTAVQQTNLSAPLPSLDLVSAFAFISPTQAVTRNAWETAGEVVYEDDPRAKRTEKVAFMPKRREPYMDGPFIRTNRPKCIRTVDSEPYAKTFGYLREIEDRREDELITPTGNIVQDFSFALDLALSEA
jgi:predicted nucleic acid-binding Zn ribbon protein